MTPDNSAYMIAGLIVTGVVAVLYPAWLVARTSAARRQLQANEEERR